MAGDEANQRTFRRLLVNTLIAGVTTTFVWFAVTFWVYLETRSVVATSILGGTFAVAAAVFGMAFGTFVDRHRKQTAIWLTTTVAAGSFAVAGAVYVLVGPDDLLELSSPWFWLFVAGTLGGAVAGQMRGIVTSTCVTLLIPLGERDKANGLVGTVTGVSFAVTSVFSGLVIGNLGMGWALGGALVAMVASLLHLGTIHIDEPEPTPSESHEPRIDVRGAVQAIRSVPGLMMLVLFAAFNNLLGGVFMSLMDAYGLSLVSVEAWGFLWGALSMGFIVGGLIVARRGLGPRPLRVILIGNLVNWSICSVFALRSSIWMLAIGMFIWLVSIPIIEAAEQTVLQQTVPFEQQGRVFGFAQTVENAASPLTSFMIGPLAEVVFIPYMTDGAGVDHIGGWFGTGPERGLALIFTLAGIIGVVVTIGIAMSKSYRRLDRHLQDSRTSGGHGAGGGSVSDDREVVHP